MVRIGQILCALVMASGTWQQTPLDTAAIDRALAPGQMQGDVYRVGLPRTDLRVTVDGIAIKPGLALGSWAAFKRDGNEAIVHGDLVLTESEINPLISALEAGHFQITALHNHLLRETPRIMYVHYWGRGSEASLAATLRTALMTTKTPLGAPAAPAAPPADPGFDAAAFQKTLGKTGAVKGGVLGVAVPRPETITMMGVTLPPSMGMATSINVQSDGAGKVVATGDFVMIDDEVNLVAAALRNAGIEITSLHNHMLHGSPALYFMHFWAHDTPDKVAAGLKQAVDKLAK